MEEPRIAAKQPAVISLDPGTYHWCLCGRSRDQPFCDGSHQGTGIEPVEFSVNEKKEVALCQCKQTKTPPYCDGTHQTL
jgi:CDGSH-type Zn-finger protein